MKRGTPEWGRDCRELVLDECGVMVTQNIAAVRNVSYGEGEHKGWYIELVDVRTGKGVGVRFTPSGRKVEVVK